MSEQTENPPAESMPPDTHRDVEDQLRAHGVRLGRGGVAPAVFWPAFAIVLGVTLITIIFPDGSEDVLSSIQNGIIDGLGWYYTLAVAAFVIFAIFLGVSRFGDITLGRDGEEPEFGLLSWFCMLFAAGMGIGLVFYGAAEPLTFATSDPKPGTEGNAAEVAQLGMAQTFVHWGFHPWAIYAIIGLALSYAIHRKGRPVSIRWALEPLFGDRVKGTLGDVIDVLAIVGTLFGVATSLGLGVEQIAAGLAHTGAIDEATDTILVILIVVITFIAIASVVSGVGKGIRWLSNFNLSLAGVFLIAVLLLGPTLFLMRDFVQSLGVYLTQVLGMTFDASAFTGEAGQTWQGTWTIFYWGWWISWAPFVGVFIARISRGRTVRQFVAGVLLVPTIVGFIWFAVMGGTAIQRELFGEGGLVDPEAGVIAENALFDMLDGLPLGALLSVIAIVLVAVFFITSSDSGSLVVDMLASGGHPDPPTWSRVLWASLEGAVAIGLLLAGGLMALRAGAIATALPFSVVLLLMCWAIYRALNREHRVLMAAERRSRRREMTRDVTGNLSENFDEHFGEQVDDRIDYALTRTTGIWHRERSPVSTLTRSRRRRGKSDGEPERTSEGEPDRPG